MAVSNVFGTRKAREWLNKQNNVPKSGNWSLGKIGRDKESDGLKYSMRIANPKDPNGPFLTVMVILVTEDDVIKVEDRRTDYQHLWS